jgi:hypothetical protein
MTRRERRMLAVLATFVLAIAAAYAVKHWPAPPPRFTREKFDRIGKGMSSAEVEAILGPPGDYSTGPTTGTLVADKVYEVLPDPLAKLVSLRWKRPAVSEYSSWSDDHGGVRVGYNASGKVAHKTLWHGRRIELDGFEWLRWQ